MKASDLFAIGASGLSPSAENAAKKIFAVDKLPPIVEASPAMKTIFGTSHFVSRYDAVKYFAAYEANPDKAVDTKLAEGSIHIGKPALKPGQKLKTNVAEGRYFIEENGAA